LTRPNTRQRGWVLDHRLDKARRRDQALLRRERAEQQKGVAVG
jgi:hypothetical protein